MAHRRSYRVIVILRECIHDSPGTSGQRTWVDHAIVICQDGCLFFKYRAVFVHEIYRVFELLISNVSSL